MKEERIFFPGLNSLRAIGAIAVCLGHIELLRKMFGLRNYVELSFYKYNLGHLGVILFFVLSGFLITYLLLEENKRTGTIGIKKFYVRRILRIWPLYYLAIAIAFILMPILFPIYPGRDLSNYTPKILLDLLFMPNVSLVVFGGISGASHLWSIGVEEQFYLMWPGIIKHFYKHALWALIAIFFGITIMPHFADWAYSHFFKGHDSIYNPLRSFFYQFKINSMALGGIIAWLYHHKKMQVLNILFKKYIEVPVFIVTMVLWFSGWHMHYFNDEFYALLFAVIIANVALNPKPVISLRIKLLDFYGSISYGFYVYHWLVIILIIKAIHTIVANDIYGNFVTDVLIYALSILTTTLVAYVSYHYFEKPILAYKKKFTVIESGNERQ